MDDDDDDHDRGTAAVLAIAIITALLVLTGMMLPLAVVLSAYRAAAGAADASALAAADAVVGIVPGSPCPVAGVVAAGNGATVTRCVIDGAIATVRVRVSSAGVRVQATATAGPPAGRIEPGKSGAPRWDE